MTVMVTMMMMVMTTMMMMAMTTTVSVVLLLTPADATIQQLPMLADILHDAPATPQPETPRRTACLCSKPSTPKKRPHRKTLDPKLEILTLEHQAQNSEHSRLNNECCFPSQDLG